MSAEIQVWKPDPFEGSDLLPLATADQPEELTSQTLVVEDDIEAEDIVLPVLQVLQGMSKPITEGIEGAQPGKLWFSGSQTVITPPARCIVVGRFRGNAMFTRKDKPQYEGLEDCISRDGVTGRKYGDCNACGRCTTWTDGPDGPETVPPLGAKTQQFVVLTADGICMLRISLSNKHATRATRDFMTRHQFTKRNWFVHPTILTVGKQESDGNTYFVPNLRWQEKILVPAHVQKDCAEWYGRVAEAREAGRLDEQEDVPDTVKDPNPSEGQSGDRPEDNIPF